MQNISKIMQFKNLDQQVNECLAAWHGQQYKNKKLQGAVKVTVFLFFWRFSVKATFTVKISKIFTF